jgi:hypothetical protein
VHALKKEGYTGGQIGAFMSISRRTVERMLNINPDYMCVDGTQTRKSYKLLDPHKEQIQELIERGFKNWQILTKLKEAYPNANIKRTTLGDFCAKLREELYEHTQTPTENVIKVDSDSMLSPYIEKIAEMLSQNKPITAILRIIQTEGYAGSYSLLQQHCLTIKPAIRRVKKAVHKIKRRDLTTALWSEKSDIAEKDMSYIEVNYPVISQIKGLIARFRTAYSNKDADAVKSWCEKYAQCEFPAICSFINGINADADAFYNSIKYEYSNGLLEGCVNKLKAVKRSMFGRASYILLRAKLLLLNTDLLDEPQITTVTR